LSHRNIQILNELILLIEKEKFHQIININIAHLACSNGQLEIVKLVISLDVDINKADIFGFTPFYEACSNGHL
jgi:ankyrin repeat protein